MKEGKEQHDYFATSFWYQDIITDPYQVVAEIFRVAPLNSFRKTIKGMLLAACDNKIFRKNSPAGLLFEMKVLESLINAAFVINKEKKASPIIIEDCNLFDKKYFCGWNGDSSDWDFLPQSLTEKEYKNPYLVFKRFFKYQNLYKWKMVLQEILQLSFSKTCEDVEIPLLLIYFHLTKLIEAAHLIDVREITNADL